MDKSHLVAGRTDQARSNYGSCFIARTHYRISKQKKNSFGIALAKALVYGSLITFVSWIIISSCGFVFTLGWGLASGWQISLIGLAAGIAGGIGAGSSLTVWAKAWDIS